MKLLRKIYNKILIDKEIYENRYWYILKNDNSIEISAIKNMKMDKVVFMNDILFIKGCFNPYLIKLNQKFPVIIEIDTVFQLINIKINNKKYRKYKIDKLLNDNS